ncbi:MAG: peroxiredoxin [Deltaproteobacteria bacterium]|nr:peroxiredoxin [Deltaproteobacteria bacterium]
MLKVGDTAPEFTQTTHEGKLMSLADLRGRKVLIWFFPEAGSPACTTEAKSFQEHRSYFEESNVTLLGASFDEIEDNAAFAQKLGVDFPLLCDTGRVLALAYGACLDVRARYPERISVLIDEDGRVMRVYDQVDPRDHAARVLVDLLEPS